MSWLRNAVITPLIVILMIIASTSDGEANGWKLRYSNDFCYITKQQKSLELRLSILLSDSPHNDTYQVFFRRKSSFLKNVTKSNTWWNISDWQGTVGGGAEWDGDRFDIATLAVAIVDGERSDITLQRDKRGDYEYLNFFDTYETNDKYNRLAMKGLSTFNSIKIETIHTKKTHVLVPYFNLDGINYAYKSLLECVKNRGESN